MIAVPLTMVEVDDVEDVDDDEFKLFTRPLTTLLVDSVFDSSSRLIFKGGDFEEQS